MFRPLDIALLLVGITVVVAIVWGGLSATQNNTGVAGQGGTGGETGSQPERNLTPLVGGVPAPDFSLPGTDGQTHTLSQYRGKVVLLEFIATWCPHCRNDAPIVNEAYEKFKDKDVQFFAVNASPYGYNYQGPSGEQAPATMADLNWFRDNYKVPFPLLFDQEFKSADDYHVAFFPTIYVVGKDGMIKTPIMAEQDKPITVDWLSEEIDKALQ